DSGRYAMHQLTIAVDVAAVDRSEIGDATIGDPNALVIQPPGLAFDAARVRRSGNRVTRLCIAAVHTAAGARYAVHEIAVAVDVIGRYRSEIRHTTVRNPD